MGWCGGRGGSGGRSGDGSGRGAVMRVVACNYLYNGILDIFIYHMVSKKSRITYMVSG